MKTKKSIQELREENERDEKIINLLLIGIICLALTIPLGVVFAAARTGAQDARTYLDALFKKESQNGPI